MSSPCPPLSPVFGKAVPPPSSPFQDYPTPDPLSTIGHTGSSIPSSLPSSPFNDCESEDEFDAFDCAQNAPDASFENTRRTPPLGNFCHSSDVSYQLISEADSVRKTRISLKRATQRVFIPLDGSEVTFGRSRACDVVIADTKNLALRKHASARYSARDNAIYFQCFGVNAMEVFVPFKANVKRLGGADRYELKPADSLEYHKLKDLRYDELVQRGLTKFPRNLEYPNGGVKVLVLNNEALRVPKSSVILDIRGACCSVEVESDEDATDEEGVVLYKVGDHLEEKKDEDLILDLVERLEPKIGTLKVGPIQIKEAIKTMEKIESKKIIQEPKPVQSAEAVQPKIEVEIQSVEPASALNNRQVEQQDETANEIVEKTQPLEPIKAVESVEPVGPVKPVESAKPAKPIEAAEVVATAEPTKPVESIKHVAENLPPISTAAVKPLSDKTNTISLDAVKEMVNKPKKRSRVIKEEPASKKAKMSNEDKKVHYDYQDPKTVIDAVNKDHDKKKILLSGVQDLDDIKKILVNHLAFSRLASTPLTALRSISKKVELLDKKSVRLVLLDIPCVGVIYRKGKDAAGKPLDEEYYYDIEKDEDEDRVQMVNNLKGGSSLRSCRKTHKQYYWKRPPPLPRY